MTENQDDFTNRMCELCDKEFDLSDPHYYDEELNCCYCSEDCYKQWCDDQWSDVYHQDDFTTYCGDHPHLEPYKGFRYFQCWGGGGEGGFIMKNDETYKVSRDWYKPFTIEPVKGKIDIRERYGLTQLRIIE